MKKIFSKLENKNDEKLSSNFVASYTGKVFVINKNCVVVEEVLAEGKIKNKFNFLVIITSIITMLSMFSDRRICDSFLS